MSKPIPITASAVATLDEQARHLALAYDLIYTPGMQVMLFKLLLHVMGKPVSTVWTENILRHSVGLPAVHSSGAGCAPEHEPMPNPGEKSTAQWPHTQ